MENDLKMQRAQALVKNIVDLPTIPTVAAKILELLNSFDIEMDVLVDMILSDQVLAARVIKVVNSPLYRPAHEINSIRHALTYLGFRHIRDTVITCSIIDIFRGKDGAFDVRTFWEHSFGVGIVSRIIAQRIRYADTEKAYLSGIIHDIGEVFLSYYLKDDFQKILELLETEPQRMIDAEERLLGTTHCHIGLCIARKWNFPQEYCDVIEHHHTPSEIFTDPLLVAIVNLADLFCSVRGLDYGGMGWVSFNLAEEEGWRIVNKYTSHRLNFDAERFCYELDDRVPEIREIVMSIFDGR